MVDEPGTQQVEVTFAGTSPARQIEQAQGVSDVHVEGRTVRCLVSGSFQPFLETLRGYEVLNLTTTPRRSHCALAAPEGEE